MTSNTQYRGTLSYHLPPTTTTSVSSFFFFTMARKRTESDRSRRRGSVAYEFRQFTTVGTRGTNGNRFSFTRWTTLDDRQYNFFFLSHHIHTRAGQEQDCLNVEIRIAIHTRIKVLNETIDNKLWFQTYKYDMQVELKRIFLLGKVW